MPPAASAPPEIAAEIARLVRREALAVGARLVELRLAATLGVSRPPIRRALEALAAQGLVQLEPGRGYRLTAGWEDAAWGQLADIAGDEEATYQRIAGDRLDGRLPDAVSEARLRADYGLTRGQAARLLDRMSAEGWVERRPGYGWRFLPMFATRAVYVQGYRFRALVEPAGLLEPGFAIDDAALARLEADQRRVVEAPFASLSLAEVFEAGCRFHETLAACGGNSFILDAVQRVNRMRRLVEYRALTADAVAAQVAEHLDILDRLRRGDRAGAADALRRHLDHSELLKTAELARGAAPTF